MDKTVLLNLAQEFDDRASTTKNDYTRVQWYLNQARNCRRMAEGLPEPKVDSHHTQFHWLRDRGLMS